MYHRPVNRSRSHSDLVLPTSLNLSIDSRRSSDLQNATKCEEKPEAITVCMSQDECPICLDEFESGSAIFTAECGHKYHFLCLLENVNHDEANADKCPICRRPQKEWPEHTEGLAKAHPFCTACGMKGVGNELCSNCGNTLAHTPTALDRAHAAAAMSNVVVECPVCRIRCLVSTNARGALQCPNGHLFQVRMPNSNGTVPRSTPASVPAIRQCPTCRTRVQMPPGSQAGQYLCPHGHAFHYRP